AAVRVGDAFVAPRVDVPGDVANLILLHRIIVAGLELHALGMGSAAAQTGQSRHEGPEGAHGSSHSWPSIRDPAEAAAPADEVLGCVARAPGSVAVWARASSSLFAPATASSAQGRRWRPGRSLRRAYGCRSTPSRCHRRSRR